MESFDTARQQIVNTAQELVAKGYLMATGGNLSLRIREQNVFAITPSNYNYMQLSPENVCVLDLNLNVLAGTLKPSVESAMHAVCYQVRSDVQAILHTHQVYASALTLIKTPIPALFDEQARFLGRSVEIIPYAPSGTGLLKNMIAKHVKNHNNAYLMQNHGALIFGDTMQRAVDNVEILEKCALAYLLALCADKPISKIPLAVREIAMAKLRKDQRKLEKLAVE